MVRKSFLHDYLSKPASKGMARSRLGLFGGLVLFGLASLAMAQAAQTSNLKHWLGGVDIVRLIREK